MPAFFFTDGEYLIKNEKQKQLTFSPIAALTAHAIGSLIDSRYKGRTYFLAREYFIIIIVRFRSFTLRRIQRKASHLTFHV